MEDSTKFIIIGSVVALIISLWIIYEIIFAASYGRKVWIESRKQTQLLTEMAKRSGVEVEIIDEILDDQQYKVTNVFRG